MADEKRVVGQLILHNGRKRRQPLMYQACLPGSGRGCWGLSLIMFRFLFVFVFIPASSFLFFSFPVCRHVLYCLPLVRLSIWAGTNLV